MLTVPVNAPAGAHAQPHSDAAPGTPRWRDLVRSVRRQLRAIPNNGFGFGALRYLGSPAARHRLAEAAPGPRITFNYLGQFEGAARHPEQGLYRAVRSSIGQDHEPADRAADVPEVVGGVQDGQLGFSWLYHPDLYHEATMQGLADDFAETLRRIARDCREVR